MKRAPASLPHVASFECQCSKIHNSRDGKIPVGWSQRGGQVFCDDCSVAGIASRPINRRARSAGNQADKLRLRGEVLQLLREGAKLMPKGTAETAEWVQRVNTMLAAQKRAA